MGRKLLNEATHRRLRLAFPSSLAQRRHRKNKPTRRLRTHQHQHLLQVRPSSTSSLRRACQTRVRRLLKARLKVRPGRPRTASLSSNQISKHHSRSVLRRPFVSFRPNHFPREHLRLEWCSTRRNSEAMRTRSFRFRDPHEQVSSLQEKLRRVHRSTDERLYRVMPMRRQPLRVFDRGRCRAVETRIFQRNKHRILEESTRRRANVHRSPYGVQVCPRLKIRAQARANFPTNNRDRDRGYRLLEQWTIPKSCRFLAVNR